MQYSSGGDIKKLTKPQEYLVDWALGGLQGGSWTDAKELAWDQDIPMEEAEKISPHIEDLKIEGGILIIPDGATLEFREWLANDLEYRLTQQAPDMEDGAYEEGLCKGQSYTGAMGGAKARTRCAYASWEVVKEHIVN